MRENHTQTLNEWRTMFVRNGITKYTSKSYGVEYEGESHQRCAFGATKKETGFAIVATTTRMSFLLAGTVTTNSRKLIDG